LQIGPSPIRLFILSGLFISGNTPGRIMLFLGIDGCKGGWYGAFVEADDIEIKIASTICLISYDRANSSYDCHQSFEGIYIINRV
ncbi:MAG: hypothetical protein MI975_27285, partial [Cytophagales bacterium]|nr:hypothetical protein [Cytophagales bacterium]